MRPAFAQAAVVPVAFWLVLLACGKTDPKDAPTPAPAPSASASASVAAAPAPVATSETWTGTYQSAPGTLFVYDGGEWKGVHFRGDDASTALGEGPISLTVDKKTGVARGTASGPLGDAILTGAVTEGELTFSVLRKDTTDRGQTGTGVAKLEGNSTSGVMHLSQGDAHVIREAKFLLSKAPH